MSEYDEKAKKVIIEYEHEYRMRLSGPQFAVLMPKIAKAIEEAVAAEHTLRKIAEAANTKLRSMLWQAEDGDAVQCLANYRNIRRHSAASQRSPSVKPEYEPKNLEQALGYLVEECGEALAAIGKTQRWGLRSVNPEIPPNKQEMNGDWILRELTDLEGAAQRARKFVEGAMSR